MDHIKPVNFDIISTTKLFKDNLNTKYKKFKGQRIAGIEIDIEQLKLLSNGKEILIMERPVAARGVVIPTETTGRKPPPNPVAFESLSKYIRNIISRKRFRVISPDSDRGHIFALQLGGPNSKYNIMPQWNGFQEYGDWRRLERSIKNNAEILLNNDNTIFLEVNIEYLNLNMKHLQEKLHTIFTFTNEDPSAQEKAKRCLQVFGTPTAYSFDSHPCNIYIKKPRNHSLSIAYIKYLSAVVSEIYQDTRVLSFESKMIAAQKNIKQKWSTRIRKLPATSLLNMDQELFNNIRKFCQQGTFALSSITQEDLN